MRYPLAKPDLRGHERKYVLEAIRGTSISSVGPQVQAFETALARRLGAPAATAVAVANGTAAIHLALGALRVGPGDEVIVPDLTYVATANAVRYTGARVVLVDVDPRTWTLDPRRVAAAVSARTKAIVAVHLYGRPADLDALMPIARQHRIALIEDAAQALGATWRGRQVGTLGTIGCFSFYGNKIITTGEGGLVVARSKALAHTVRHLRDQAMSKTRRYFHDQVGFNYRLTALQAAIGLAQLERLDAFLAKRAQIAEWYRAELGAVPGLAEPVVHPHAVAVNWLFTFALQRWNTRSRDQCMKRLRAAGVESRPLFVPMSHLPMYAADTGDVARLISAQGISLPTHTGMRRHDVRAIAQVFRQCIVDRQGR